MHVYRIENKQGNGPFIGGGKGHECDMSSMPGPFSDMGLCWNPGDGGNFAFTSIESFLQYVTERDAKALEEEGYHINVYCVDNAVKARSEIQTVFDKDKARRMRKWRMMDFYQAHKQAA